ncbi:MAG TPA: serine protease [Solirubrobacteraceae bacterium]|jgi:secreted trypsin-like serine protease
MARVGTPKLARFVSLGAAFTAAAAILFAATSATAGAISTHPTNAPRAHVAIVGGSAAVAGALPSLALISDNLGGGETAYCTGTVVAANVVLTAAHCLEDESGNLEPAAGFTVASGTVDPTDDPKQVSGASQVLIYPGYNRTEDNGDAGLLILSTSTSAPAATLANSSDSTYLQSGTSVAVAGWGLTGANATAEPATLQWASMGIQENTYCEVYDDQDNLQFQFNYEFCALGAQGAPVSVCHGDSGGPAFVVPSPGTLIEVGIVDRGDNGCAPNVPSIFTRVDLLQSWVAQEIAANPPTAPAASGNPLTGSPGGAAGSGGTAPPSTGPAVTSALAAAVSGSYTGSSAQRRGRVTLKLGAHGITSVGLRYNLRCGGAWRGPLTSTKSMSNSPIKLVARAHAWSFSTRYRDSAGDAFVLSGRLPKPGRAVGSFSVTTPQQHCKSGTVAWSASLPAAG